jgi:hypothetical protein
MKLDSSKRAVASSAVEAIIGDSARSLTFALDDGVVMVNWQQSMTASREHREAVKQAVKAVFRGYEVSVT